MFLVEKDVRNFESIMNLELAAINEWIQTNKLSLNLSKTNFMLFKGRKTIEVLPEIVMNQVKISPIEKSKFLGVIIDDKLTWTHHIDHVCKKVSKSIGILYKLKRYLNIKSLISMYYCFVYPYFQYCNEVWGNACATYLKRLEILQKRAIRIISNVDRFHHTASLFAKLKILKFKKINDYMMGLIMYKAHWEILPAPVQSLFEKNETIHDHNTRQKFHLPGPKSNLFQRTVAYKGVHVWHFILKNISIKCSFDRFKIRLKNLYLNSDIP